MAQTSPSPSSPSVAPPLSSSLKENRANVGSKMAELDKSQSELVTRIQGLKQEMQNWRSKLDTQVKTYKDELSELKSSISHDLEQLKSEFQELRVTLQQQQEDVTNSLKTLGLEDLPKDLKHPENPEETQVIAEHVDNVPVAASESSKEAES